MRAIEKAEKLAKSPVLQAGHVGWSAENGIEQRGGAHPDSLDAAILTVRLFIQDNDGISFRAIADLVAADPGVSHTCRTELDEMRTVFNKYLDEPPPIQISIGGAAAITRRQMLETFVYGDLAHTNRRKRAKLEIWKRHEPTEAALKMYFWDTVRSICVTANRMKVILQEEMAR